MKRQILLFLLFSVIFSSTNIYAQNKGWYSIVCTLQDEHYMRHYICSHPINIKSTFSESEIMAVIQKYTFKYIEKYGKKYADTYKKNMTSTGIFCFGPYSSRSKCNKALDQRFPVVFASYYRFTKNEIKEINLYLKK